jgi:tetratricopeptide (TPR) repeat protein
MLKKLPGGSFSLLSPIIVALLAASSVGSAAALPQGSWTVMIATGDTHLKRKEYPLAEECYEQALLQVKRGPHDPDDQVKCMQKVAAALQLQNITEDVMPLYKKSLKILERAHGKESPELVPTLYAMGAIHETEDDRKQAVTIYTRALAINRKNFAPDSLNVADSLHRLARAEVAARLLQPAEQLYLESLTLYMHQPSLPSTTGLENLLSDYIDLLNKLDLPTRILPSDFQAQLLKDRVGSLNLNMGLPQSYWQKQVSALLTNSRANTSAKSDTVESSSQPAQSLPSQQSSQSAQSSPQALTGESRSAKKFASNEVDFYERMVAIDLKALGQNHPTVADDLTALAAVYIAQHRYTEAKPLLNRALTIYENVYGANNLLVARTRTALTQVVKLIQHPDILASEYTDPSALANIPSQAKSLEISLKLNDLAFLCYCQGKIDNAVNIYHWALASTAGATGKQSTLSAACLTDFATVLRSTSQAAEAGKMLESASSILSNAEASKNVLLR